MKKVILAVAIAITCNVHAGEIDFVGQFSMPRKTAMFGYDNKQACVADKGEWLTEDGICMFDSSDDVKVEDTASGLTMKVETIGTNAHSCGFEATAQVKDFNVLVGALETEVHRYNEETKESEWVKAVCEVTLTYKNSDVVKVDNNGNCQEFCGMRAQLYIDEAKRVAPKAE
jgi:hypothetical protein